MLFNLIGSLLAVTRLTTLREKNSGILGPPTFSKKAAEAAKSGPPYYHANMGIFQPEEEDRKHRAQAPSSGDCVNGLAPTSIARWNERSIIRWQHRLQREHPTCTERSNRSLRVRMEGWRQGWHANGLGRSDWTTVGSAPHQRGVAHLPSWRNGDRAVLAVKGSLRRKERALDRSGPLCKPSARKEGGF